MFGTNDHARIKATIRIRLLLIGTIESLRYARRLPPSRYPYPEKGWLRPNLSPEETVLLGNQSQFQPQLFNKLHMFWSAWRECLESTKHLNGVSF